MIKLIAMRGLVLIQLRHENKPSRVSDRRPDVWRSSESESSVAHVHQSRVAGSSDSLRSFVASWRANQDRKRLGQGPGGLVQRIMTDVILITAGVTVVIMIMARLAYIEAKRRAKARWRKLRRKVGPQSHRVYHREAEAPLGYNIVPWSKIEKLYK